MESLEPGGTVQYKTERFTAHVFVLSFRQKKNAMRCFEQVANKDRSMAERFDAMEESFKSVTPESEWALLDRLTDSEVIEVINFALNGARLTGEERKKSESPQL